MADITVRKLRFDFADPIDLDMSDEDLGEVLPALGLSMTMPYLEPYLIRTMKVALKSITNPELAADVRHFSQQEGHHYRNHAEFNVKIRDYFDDTTAAELVSIEEALEADYQRFTREKSLRFNVTYAEGFEAMTCAGALAMAEHGLFDPGSTPPGGELWAWHMAEEIEHRTVAFNVFEELVGSYPYRIFIGSWSQYHYLSYIGRFAKCMANALGRPLVRVHRPMQRTAIRRYLKTWNPRYNPAEIDMPQGVEELLTRFSAMAETTR